MNKNQCEQLRDRYENKKNTKHKKKLRSPNAKVIEMDRHPRKLPQHHENVKRPISGYSHSSKNDKNVEDNKSDHNLLPRKKRVISFRSRAGFSSGNLFVVLADVVNLQAILYRLFSAFWQVLKRALLDLCRRSPLDPLISSVPLFPLDRSISLSAERFLSALAAWRQLNTDEIDVDELFCTRKNDTRRDRRDGDGASKKVKKKR